MNKCFAIMVCFLVAFKLSACQCPLTQLSMAECEKYDVIFKGIIKKATMCDNKPGEAIFEIDELYKGNVTKSYKILFDCNTECAQKLSIGDEWIVYANYKQINNAALNWCSRSRKYFKIENQDFYKVITGVDYTDELNYLRKELGLHRFIKANNIDDGKRNILPNLLQSSLLLIASLIGMVVFYWLFKKFVK